MARAVIEDYLVAWNIEKDQGGISVKAAGSSDYRKVPISTYQEFLALLTLLQGPKAIYYDSDRTYFATRPD
jgi:hypothetical protein